MKKKYIAAGMLSVFFLFCLCPKAFAEPAAELSIRIEDLQQVGDAVEFSAVIDIGKPSEPYASLDFSIVSSNEESLHIVDLSETGDKSSLAFEFSPDYGGVYHEGRAGEADGSVSYLVGLFSQESGNNIEDEINICSVRFRYTGDSEEELSLENLKLVYKNPEGDIVGVPLDGSVSQPISHDKLVRLTDEPTPLAGDRSEDDVFSSSVVYALVAAVALIVALIILRANRKSRRNYR